jgi:hypothetical protein
MTRDTPASRMAEVNRGTIMPLRSSADRPLILTMTIEVHSEEGVTPETLDNKIKEKVRQIGVMVVAESKI